jgi:hypothetical protein
VYSYEVNADGYPVPTYTLTTFPVGMTIDATTGLIQWTPASGGDVTVTVEAVNGVNPSSTQSFLLTVPVPEVIPAGLVAYWHLDEAAGNTYVDITGTNNGTGNLSPTSVAGKANGAQQFNGTTTKIEVPASPTFDVAAKGNFSVEFWYKSTNAPTEYKVVIGRYIPDGGGKYWYVGFYPGSGKLSFSMVGGGVNATAYATNSILDGNWHHVAATRNGTTGESKIFVDGNLNSSAIQSLPVDFSSPTSKLEIGSLLDANILEGSLDELALHNVELSPAEILQHYTNGSHGVGYYSSYAPAITSAAPLNGTVGNVYSYEVNADGYPVPTYTLTTFPVGMTIDATTGLIQWTPAAAGDVNVTVEASNGVSPASIQSFILSVVAPIVVPAGLVAYWHLDEVAGNTYVDITGTHNGTGNLSPTTVAGKANGGQQFNGTTTKIDVPASPTFDVAANGNFSVEFWYKSTNAPTEYKVVIGRYIPNGGGKYWYVGFYPGSGKLSFSMVGGGVNVTAYATNSILDGNWHHVAATRNGTTGESKIFVDGNLNSSAIQSLPVDFSSPTSKLEIGSLLDANILEGSLDELALHNVELSPAEILQHYNNGVGGFGYFDPMAPAVAMPVKVMAVGNDVDESELAVSILSAYAFQNIEIRIIGDVKRGALATLYDLQGRVVEVKKLEEGNYNTLRIPDNTGIYILRVIDQGKMQTIKIFVKD